MEYMILDSLGNAVTSSHDELTARATMHAIVAIDPDAAEHLMLLPYDDDGMPVGDACTYVDVRPAVDVHESDFVVRLLTETLVRAPRDRQTCYVGGISWPTRVAAGQPIGA